MKKYFIALSFVFINSFAFTQLTFQDYLVRKLDQTNFSPSAEKLAREVAGNFLKLYNYDKFKEVYSYDPILHSYEIDDNRLPYDLRSIDWSGSKDAISTNLLGKYTSRDFKVYNSLVASWLNEYIAEYVPKPIVLGRMGIKKAFLELFSYIAIFYYNNNMDLCILKWREIVNINERATKLLTYLRENVEQYLEDYNQNKNIDEFSNVDKVMELKTALDSNNWNTIETAFNKLGYSLNTYLYK